MSLRDGYTIKLKPKKELTMWTLTTETINMMKKDAGLNHKAALVNFNRYKELLNSSDFKDKIDYMKQAIVLAKSDFENAMNLYATISLYCEEYSAPIASKLMYQKSGVIFKHLLELEESVTSDGGLHDI